MLQQNMSCFATVILLSLIQLKRLDPLLIFFSKIRNIKPPSLEKGNLVAIWLSLKLNCIINKLNKSNEFIITPKVIILDICFFKGTVITMCLESYLTTCPENFAFGLFIILLIHR